MSLYKKKLVSSDLSISNPLHPLLLPSLIFCLSCFCSLLSTVFPYCNLSAPIICSAGRWYMITEDNYKKGGGMCDSESGFPLCQHEKRQNQESVWQRGRRSGQPSDSLSAIQVNKNAYSDGESLWILLNKYILMWNMIKPWKWMWCYHRKDGTFYFDLIRPHNVLAYSQGTGL